MKISVVITLKKDVLDPQGKVIHQTLDGMGFDDVNEVRQGKYFEIDTKEEDPKKAKNKVEEIVSRTRNGGGEIVALMKNSSAFFSPAASAIEMLESYLFDNRRILPCSAYLEGEYNVKGLCVGVPIVISKNGVEEIIELDLKGSEKNEFDNSVGAVDELVQKCKKLLVANEN